MTNLSLTILIAALLVSSPALSSGRNAHASSAIAIDHGHFVVTQSRSHPQSRLTRQAYKRPMEGRRTQRSSVPINQPGRDSFIPVSGFMGKARSHQYQTAFYLRELHGISAILDANLATLDGLISEGER